MGAAGAHVVDRADADLDRVGQDPGEDQGHDEAQRPQEEPFPAGVVGHVEAVDVVEALEAEARDLAGTDGGGGRGGVLDGVLSCGSRRPPPGSVAPVRASLSSPLSPMGP